MLKAAMEVFARKGYAAASIREICCAAGVTKPVLYYYFRSKEHLYQELMIDCFGFSLKTLLRASKSEGSIRQRLVRIINDDFKSIRQSPARAQFLLRMIFSPEEQQPYFNYVRETERQRDAIAGVLQEGIDGGVIRGDGRRLATALMGMDLMVILESLFTGRRTLTRRTAERHVDLLLKGCSVG